MNNPFVQWAGFVVGTIALIVSVYNLLLTHRRNSRDATFKMLDRWMADAMRTARHKVIVKVREADRKSVQEQFFRHQESLTMSRMIEARKKRLAEVLAEREPHISQHAKDEDLKELEEACAFNHYQRTNIFNIAMRYEQEVAKTLDRFESPPDGDVFYYKMWHITAIDHILSIRKEHLTTEEQDGIWERSWDEYIASESYGIDIYDDDLRAEMLGNAQVTAELKALFDANVLDRKLVKALFSQSMSEWSDIADRLHNSVDDTEDAWLTKYVAPFPDYLEAYQPPSIKTALLWVAKSVSPSSIRRMHNSWSRMQAILFPNQAVKDKGLTST